MTFNNPYSLIWALAGIPLVLLYLRRIRPPVRRVATGFFWEETLGRGGISDAWRRRRHVVSLVLLLAILGLLVLAMAEPTGRPPLRAVLVIDHSLGMKASIDDDPEGTPKTRFDRAKQMAARWIDQMGERDRIGLVAGGAPAWIACRPTNRRAELSAALERITPDARSGGLAEATQAARRLLRDEGSGGRIVVLTDGRVRGQSRSSEAADWAKTQDVELVVIASPAANMAVTRLAARRLTTKETRWQAFVEVARFAETSVTRDVTLDLDGRQIEAAPFKLPASGTADYVFEFDAPDGGRLTARVDADDDFAADDSAAVVLPEFRPRRVWVLSDGFALPSMGLEEATVVSELPDSIPEDVSLVLWGDLPSRLPDAPLLVFDPGGSTDLWELGEPIEDPVVARENVNLPLFEGLSIVGVHLPDARRIQVHDDLARRSEPLAWTAAGEPLGFAIERPSGRVLVLPIGLNSGELPRTDDFPALLSNALAWLGQRDTSAVVSSDGLWLQAAEADLRAQAPGESPPALVGLGRSGSPWWPPLVGLAVLAVLAEWLLFQRRWTT